MGDYIEVVDDEEVVGVGLLEERVFEEKGVDLSTESDLANTSDFLELVLLSKGVVILFTQELTLHKH